MLRKFASRHVLPLQRSQPVFPRFFSSLPIDNEDEETSSDGLLDLHFTQEDDGVKRPFRFVGVRDVEIEDLRYENRDQTVQSNGAPIVLRNTYGYSNFISLYVDVLPKCVDFMKQNNIPHDPIKKNSDGVDVVTIPPTPESAPHFNLCDKPAFVELLQATPELIAEFENDRADTTHTVE